MAIDLTVFQNKTKEELSKEEIKAAQEPLEEAKEMTEHEKILKAHGGLESNIPVNHYYWKIRP